ncbi:MAG: cysteine hydrolase [Ruminococcaceae bacterium]|nr:cysteine hydrolase [Oscillospiraceae bacterium]
MDVLVVVDMQNDFISGALGTAEARAIVAAVAEKIANFEGRVIFTRDTHGEDYLSTREGKNLPVVHCVKNTWGWQLCDELLPLAAGREIFDKPTFGSVELAKRISALAPDRITLVGLCTDICVISNAMLLKAALPEADVAVEAALCAGVTPKSHENAMNAMKMCQIEVV